MLSSRIRHRLTNKRSRDYLMCDNLYGREFISYMPVTRDVCKEIENRTRSYHVLCKCNRCHIPISIIQHVIASIRKEILKHGNNER